MEQNSIVTNSTSDLAKLYSDLYAKEYPEHKVGKFIIFGNCPIAFSEKKFIVLIREIFEKLEPRDRSAFAVVNRSCFLITNNANQNFWDKYTCGLIQLKPGKSVLTCLPETPFKTMSGRIQKLVAYRQSEDTYIAISTSEHENTTRPGDIILGSCTTAFPAEIMMNIFNSCFTEDIIAFSQTNKAAFLLTHNINQNFWKAYAPEILYNHFVYFNPAKSALNSMINTGEEEMGKYLELEIAKIQPFQEYLFQCSFISPKGLPGRKELLNPAVEIRIAHSNSEGRIVKEWIFKNVQVILYPRIHIYIVI